MPQLTVPTTAVHASFLQAMEEFRAEGRGEPEDGSAVAREIRAYASRWHDPAVFAEYTAWLREQVTEEAAALQARVPCTHFWYTDGDAYLGRIAVRHRLDSFLLDFGGHIGYDVRPTARRRGHATAMLRAVLPHARRLGLDDVLVTCDHDNAGSRKVIEACGGVREDRRGSKLRYWVPAPPAE